MHDGPPAGALLIGSGSQEEVDHRVKILLDMGTSRGYLTYEELNTKLPDEVVSPDKLDSLLMMIDEMGIKLIDESDIGDFIAKPRGRTKAVASVGAIAAEGSKSKGGAAAEEAIEDEEEIDLNLEKELAEASTKRIDDPVRMYLTQMGEIPSAHPRAGNRAGERRSKSRARFSAARCWRATTASRVPRTFCSRSMTVICRSIAR